jgi:hypothetical protein
MTCIAAFCFSPAYRGARLALPTFADGERTFKALGEKAFKALAVR